MSHPDKLISMSASLDVRPRWRAPLLAPLGWLLPALAGCAGTEGPVLRSNAAPVGGWDTAFSGGAAGAPQVGGDAGTTDEPIGGDAGGGATRWVPAAEMTWQIQLEGVIDRSVAAEFFAIDLESVADIAALNELGRAVCCHFSAGTFEYWREDADAIPSTAVGEQPPTYPNERWLDIRDESVRAVMQARFREAAELGCRAALPANLDGYLYESGFALTVADTVEYANQLAEMAHAEGLSVALTSTDEALVVATEAHYDWVLAVGCLEEGACGVYDGYFAQGKPVFLVEYLDEDPSLLCEQAAGLGANLILKDPSLGAFRLTCSD